jgi:hypothetical protein
MSCAISSEPPFSRKFVMPLARKEWLPIGAQCRRRRRV